jgi:hypothetical protein
MGLAARRFEAVPLRVGGAACVVGWRRVRDGLVGGATVTILLAAAGAGEAAVPSHEGSTTRPVALFQPGVVINWERLEVEVEATVVLREGMLELLACSAGTKEHESILAVHARPFAIYQAMGLIGLQPGEPPHREVSTGKIVGARGQRLELLIRHEVDGAAVTVGAWRWICDARTGEPVEQDWVFAGSVVLADGSFYADEDGTVVGLVDFPGVLIGPSESRSSSDAELTLQACRDAVPAPGTPCTLIIRGRREGAIRIGVDRFGRYELDGERLERIRLAERVRERVREGGDVRVVVTAGPGALPEDIADLSDLIREAGVAAERIEIGASAGTSLPANDPEAAGAFAHAQMELHRALLERIGVEGERLSERLSRRRAELEQQGAMVRENLARLRDRLREATHGGAASSQPAR